MRRSGVQVPSQAPVPSPCVPFRTKAMRLIAELQDEERRMGELREALLYGLACREMKSAMPGIVKATRPWSGA